MRCYYNEIDKYCAQWLRNLIAAGHIAPGDVDTRSIREVKYEDIHGYDQYHFFAGIGCWSLALRLAGWPDNRPVWTGSCPCQPFSVAGKRKGAEDERHLWPDFARLIKVGSPATIFGEQVASKDGREWLSGVRTDVEALGYEIGSADLCAAGVGENGEIGILRGDQIAWVPGIIGAPHIRQRLYWGAFRLGNAREPGLEGWRLDAGEHASERLVRSPGAVGNEGVAESEYAKRGTEYQEFTETYGRNGFGGCGNVSDKPAGSGLRSASGDIGQWSNFDIIPCLDRKARRVESGTFPLAHGVKNRVGRLRAYGNAIVAPLAAEFIRACEECRP